MIRLIFALMAMCVWQPFQALASSSLTFEGGGYEIEMVVGSDDHGETIMIEKFYSPEDTEGVGIKIAAKDVCIKKFDSSKQRLELEYIQPEAGQGPESFILTVDRDTAILKMNGREISSSFQWGM